MEDSRLLRACAILFGDAPHISREFLEYLQVSGLKNAYRRRALETHPDRLIAGHCAPNATPGSSFPEVCEAFQQLHRYVQHRGNRNGSRVSVAPVCGEPGTNEAFSDTIIPRDSRKPPATPSGIDSLYHGPMPKRRLLFGHFLFYSGLADWRAIACILLWQRKERPRLGEIAMRGGMLHHDEIRHILHSKAPLQPFGQAAMQLGYLREDQVRVLISRQRNLQKKFGTILLERKLLNSEELEDLLKRFEYHNAQIATDYY